MMAMEGFGWLWEFCDIVGQRSCPIGKQPQLRSFFVNLGVLCVFVVNLAHHVIHHRDTEHTEDAQTFKPGAAKPPVCITFPGAVHYNGGNPLER